MTGKSFAIYFCFLAIATLFADTPLQAVEKERVEKTLRDATRFFREHVSTEGGYLWRYTSDLSRREGENKADDRTVWVQPPGTPSIGMTFLRAWQVTGDRQYLDAAKDAGDCLVRGQLRSGGWTYMIYFDDKRRETQDYRTEKNSPKKAKNTSTLDDNTTQSAAAFLMELDRALDFKDETIHEAARYALDKLLEAQFPNGAFAQRFYGTKHDPKKHPAKPASYPPEGTEPTHDPDYGKFYTFNDNLALDINRTFFAAASIYGTKKDGVSIPNEKYLNAAKRLGDFILLARMPEPQPVWAQQYDFEMRPCWARKFEPASITGGETQGLLSTLFELYVATGEKKYLEPIPGAVEYLKKSLRPDGKLARFYELKTNKPLYFTKDYKLTYSDADMPTHYAFVIEMKKFPVEQWMNMDEPTRLRLFDGFQNRFRQRELPKTSEKEIRRVVESIDSRGAWVTEGKMKDEQEAGPVIDCRVFIQNVNVLLSALRTAGSSGSN